ncbi:MAG: acyl-CoA thioesterase [Bacteroidota bacterium]
MIFLLLLIVANSSIEYRAVSESRTQLTELMIPTYANFGGKVHGGLILSLMDKIAYACATRHARMYCVTASVDTVDFRSAVEVGNMLHMYASVNYVGNSSMEVGIRTESHDIRSGESRHTNTSYFTMVGMGEDGKAAPVPGLLLESEEDIRRFLEAMQRRGLAKRYRKASNEIKSSVEIESERALLDQQKCKVNWQP